MWALASLGTVEARMPPVLCTSDQSSELHFEAAVAQREGGERPRAQQRRECDGLGWIRQAHELWEEGAGEARLAPLAKGRAEHAHVCSLVRLRPGGGTHLIEADGRERSR